MYIPEITCLLSIVEMFYVLFFINIGFIYTPQANTTNILWQFLLKMAVTFYFFVFVVKFS